MTKKIKNLVIFASLIIAVFTVAHFSLAANIDVGLNYAAGIGLSAANDPRIIAANIIRIALGFLGIIAVVLIIYAGWLWMTADGQEEKIDKAKKILTGAVIGLVITLSAFAIASFILSRLIGAVTGGDGTVCDPPCGDGQFCCNSSCSSTPCNGGGGGDFFNIRSTIPKNLDTGVIRNAAIKVFFNKTISDTVSQAILDNNFKVEKIAVIDPETKVETDFGPELEAGTVSITPGRQEIDFKNSAACGDEAHTPNCFPEWSKFRVTVDGSDGIISANGQSLNCSLGSSCQFVFSTSNVIDTSGPEAGVLPVQICQDDGSLALIPDANLVNGWARDDLGVSDIKFCSEKSGDTENCFIDSVKTGGPGQTYLSHSYKYDTSGYQVDDNYIFRVKASDVAAQIGQAEFSAKIRAGHCCNGLKDFNETEVDCGGECGACEGAACANDMSEPAVCSDNLCASQVCRSEGSAEDSCAQAGYAAGTESCCLCQRPPVITGLSPLGGFCADDLNKACLADSDCGAGVECDISAPNGAVGNFFTVHGKNFGASPGKVFSSNGNGDWLQAKLANDLMEGNDQCGDNVWTDSQIIAVVPAGAITGAIKVETMSGLSATSDKTGLPDFKINTIDRPGLCLLNPNHGKQDEIINYNGIKLLAVSPYFGNLDNKIAGVDPIFNNKNGIAKVPNLAAGRTTSFVIKGLVMSNFLNFTKEAEADKGPFIYSFDPHEGSAGQYITINGSGFGNTKGASKVYFGAEGGAEADFNFPEICATSIWSDRQVIVKVPVGLANGNYKITMKIGAWPAIDTDSIQPAVNFEVDSNLPLKPSLCKINPIIGQANSQINLYGEYFGQQDSNSKVRFQLNKDQTVFDYWQQDDDPKIIGIKPDKVITKVPVEAVTGPVKAVKGDPELVGNGLNFTVGVCRQSADCGLGNLCCPAGTPYAGQCKTGTDEQDVCFPEIKACVYEWNFSTKGSVCSDSQEQCGFSCCNKSDSCDPEFDNGTGKCDSISCAPGVITCGDQCCPGAVSCDIETGACPGPCAADQVKCDIPDSQQFNCCNSGQCNQLTGQCDSCLPTQDQCGDGSCCSGISQCKDTDDNPETPTECIDPLACAGYGNQCSDSYFCPNSPGKCSLNPGGATVIKETGRCDYSCNNFAACQSDLCEYHSGLNKCLIKENQVCQLIKIVKDIHDKDINANCLDYNGQGRWIINTNLSCPDGWTNIGGNRCLENNTTCQLCGQGFKCLADGLGGNGLCAVNQNVCPTDSVCGNDNKCLSVKIDSAGCECCCRKDNGNQDCCAPLKCEGSCGAETNPANTKFGLCTGCGSVGATQSEHNQACNCSGGGGKFCLINDANPGGVCQDCAAIKDAEVCSGQGVGVCCVDAEKDNACRSGTDTVKSSDTDDQNNYCAYYECQITGVSATCNGPVISSDLPAYRTQTDCQAKCALPPQFGQQCSAYNSVNGQKTVKDSCDLNQCPNFSCLNSDGSGPTAPNSCGTCCCDPKKTGENDQCKRFINPKLSCYADKGSCSGANRGLCCGCSKDNECGDSNVGCGGDTCCQARPKIIEVAPVDGANKVCRNSLIKATFNQAMKISTFNTNVIVIGEYGASPCPDGSEYLTAVYKPNIFARIKFWLARLPLANKLIASEARALTGNYCSAIGQAGGLVKTGVDGVKTTDLEFRLQKALEANRKYYVIIKGDSDITDALSNGVLSQAGIGMKAEGYNSENPVIFNGLAFSNAKIWSFITMGENEVNKGICTIDNVKVSPGSYVFQTNENDNRDDNQADKETFNMIADSDLVFSAQAYANNGQLLTATPEYSWQWTWASANEAIAQAEKLAEPEPFKAIVRAQEKITDGQTEITATADFSGLAKTGRAKIYVFLCKNIWPAPKDIEGNLIWEPWRDNKDNCTVADKHNCGGNKKESCCYETNYELYYCRDAGTEATADDLPAILSDKAVIRPYDSDKQKIIKEFYFFREDLPLSAEDFSVRALEQGGSVLASWNPVVNAVGYKVYYGAVSGKYTASADVGDFTSKEITGLVNGRKYYFALTSYNDKKAESDYSNPVSLTPSDSRGPIAPIISALIAKGNKVEVVWEDQSQADAKRFKLFYGATNNDFGSSVNIGYNSHGTTTVSNLGDGVTYYFGLVAYDFANNASATSTVRSIAAGIDLSAVINNIVKQGGKAALEWDKFAPPDGQTINQYIIEYGTEINLLSMSASTSTLPTAVNPQIIGDLVNGAKYYFAVKAEYRSGEESAYSNVISVAPADIWPPYTPENLAGESGAPGEKKAVITWKPNQDDAINYKIYYGGISGNLRATINLNKDQCLIDSCSIDIDDLNTGAKYYFSIAALDSYNNESDKPGEINLIIK